MHTSSGCLVNLHRQLCITNNSSSVINLIVTQQKLRPVKMGERDIPKTSAKRRSKVRAKTGAYVDVF